MVGSVFCAAFYPTGIIWWTALCASLKETVEYYHGDSLVV